MKNVYLDKQSILFIQKQSQNQLINSFLNFNNQLNLEKIKCKILDQQIINKNSYREILQSLTDKKQDQIQGKNKELNKYIYLSPQLLEQLKRKNTYPKFNPKSDIFALGMLIMQLCCQQQMNFCYQMETYTFDYESLIHRIAKISYSNELKLLLAEMLQYDQENRIGFTSLKQKLQKIIDKPFEQTKKLKRRSSSTMLKELLSCSRASFNSKEKILKEPIIIKNQSNLKQSPVTHQNSNHSQDKSLRKSSSLVSLKCRPSAFLSNKKNIQLKINNQNSNFKFIGFINQNDQNLNKNRYQSILKNRIKTQYKQEIQQSTIKKQLTQNSENNLTQINFERPYQNKKFQIQQGKEFISQRNLTSFNHSYVQKKVINLNKLQFSVQNKSLQPQKMLKVNKSKEKLNQLTKIQRQNKQNYQEILQNGKQIPLKEQTNQQSLIINKFISNYKLEKNFNKEQINTNINLNNQININKKNDKLKIENKELQNSNKNWIMGKLKLKNSKTKNIQIQFCNNKINKLLVVKPKKSDKKQSKQSSLSKSINKSKNMSSKRKQQIKQDQNKININVISPFQSQNNYSHQNQNIKILNKNDTIIKKLQLTNQNLSYQQKQNSNRKSSQNIKNIQSLNNNNNILKKQISQIRESKKQDNRTQIDNYKKNLMYSNHDNLIKYPKFVQRIQQSKNQLFKKKSKIIDVDLNNYAKQQKSEKSQSKIKNNKQIKQIKQNSKSQSRLSKLKKLTIFTEQSDKQYKNMGKNTIQNDKKQISANLKNNENKQNIMQKSNLNLSSYGNFNETNKQFSKVIQSLQGKNQKSLKKSQVRPIPYQHIEYVNIIKTQYNEPLITPQNLNQLNKVYGNGMTLKSIDQQNSGIHNFKNSTLSKPFQQIELEYFQPHHVINELQLTGDTKQITSHRFDFNQEPKIKDQIIEKISNKNQNCYQEANCQELTFRLKGSSINNNESQKYAKKSIAEIHLEKMNKYHYLNHQKKDGSFIMREYHPFQNIQSSSIIGYDKKGTQNHLQKVDQLFKSSQKYQNLYESKYQRKQNNQQSQMNSSCDSINLNLSQIQFTKKDQNSQFLVPYQNKQNSKSKKYKHVSILQSFEGFNNGKGINLHIKNINLMSEKNNEANFNDDYNTYRKYLRSNNKNQTHIIHFNGEYVYQGELNQNQEFQGNGIVTRQGENYNQNILIYTGSFLKGCYHGFGTLYEIQNDPLSNKYIKVPTHPNRISFGSSKYQIKQQKHSINGKAYLIKMPIKYQGQFTQGKQNGFGTYYFSDGQKFTGCIKKGMIEGYGSYHFADGSTISGMWKNNCFLQS